MAAGNRGVSGARVEKQEQQARREAGTPLLYIYRYGIQIYKERGTLYGYVYIGNCVYIFVEKQEQQVRRAAGALLLYVDIVYRYIYVSIYLYIGHSSRAMAAGGCCLGSPRVEKKEQQARREAGTPLLYIGMVYRYTKREVHCMGMYIQVLCVHICRKAGAVGEARGGCPPSICRYSIQVYLCICTSIYRTQQQSDGSGWLLPRQSKGGKEGAVGEARGRYTPPIYIGMVYRYTKREVDCMGMYIQVLCVHIYKKTGAVGEARGRYTPPIYRYGIQIYKERGTSVNRFVYIGNYVYIFVEKQEQQARRAAGALLLYVDIAYRYIYVSIYLYIGHSSRAMAAGGCGLSYSRVEKQEQWEKNAAGIPPPIQIWLQGYTYIQSGIRL